ncbi:glucose dehydrogenase [FAD, quinone]-like [Neodiprion virginianus]|uniref:glucose dehydrogenase [FAD, quinone]-like n=1 Tax=Neodiprion virginianus TaxID=2961670 RepID=UPI001EE75B6B|nr:glucose dehydrogenase [FAD, quinone]-like [Neodiprion virginianus]
MAHSTSSLTCNASFLGPTLQEMCGGSSYYLFMSLLNAFAIRKQAIGGTCERVTSIVSPNREYDYVVIGGGSAGAVVASRLSENPKWKVLVLEAGPDEPPGAEIPSFFNAVVTSSLDWGYSTTNESYACYSTNGSCTCHSVKVLGGNMVHTGMIYLRGNPTDYDKWAALGNKGWSWKDVKPFYLKCEDNREIDRVGRFWHATGGPLSVQRFPYEFPITKAIRDASLEAGFGTSDDLNGDQLTGFNVVQTTTKNGVRQSTGTAYLRPVRDRKNLHISLNSTVAKIIINNKTAVGVEYYQNGQLKKVAVSREVILSAGTVGSPQILLLSGVGPKEHLESMGIEVVKDLPGVGENYHDHISYSVDFTVNEPDVYDNNWAAATEYFAFQTGPLSASGLAGLAIVLNSSKSTSDYPDIQLAGYGYIADCAPGDIGALRSKGKRTVSIWVGYQHPKSRGRVRLASKNVTALPVIWGNYLADYRDVEGLIEGINYTLTLSKMEAFKPYNLTLTNQPVAACSDYTFLTNEYWACAIRWSLSPQNHQVGSCKMGPPDDPTAVVDPKLRVYGINRLRVADASIMPQIISANTAAPTVMIAEKAADMIKKSHQHRSCKNY